MASYSDINTFLQTINRILFEFNTKKIIYKDIEISHSLMCYLNHIFVYGYDDNRKFSQEMNVSESASIQAINQLCKKGLILREINIEDKRRRICTVTTLGRMLCLDYKLSQKNLLKSLDKETLEVSAKNLDDIINSLFVIQKS